MQDKSVQGIWIFLITILKKHIVTVNVCFIQLVDKDTLCLLYTSDAADDMQCVDLGGRRIIKKIKGREGS